MFKILKGDIFFASAKTHGIMLYYHFARKFIFKVSFDSQLNYVLHRDNKQANTTTMASDGNYAS